MVLFTLVLALAFLQPVKVSAYVLPKDLPTIEALIALHKAVKKDEDQALQRVATSFGEQSLLTKGAVKFNDVRTTLDTKLSNAHSYLVLAGAISLHCQLAVPTGQGLQGLYIQYVQPRIQETIRGMVLCGCQRSHFP